MTGILRALQEEVFKHVEEQRRLQKLVDAFLRNKELTEEELKTALRYRGECIKKIQERGYHGSSTRNDYVQLLRATLPIYLPQSLADKLKGQRVIELGPGERPNAEFLFERYGIAEYIAVEPFLTHLTERTLNTKDPRNRIVEEDGLSYLLRQPDSSAVIISSAVICTELMTDIDGKKRTYYKFLGREMHRVTPFGAPTIHYTTGLGKEDTEDFFTMHGFEPIITMDEENQLECILVKP